MKLVIFGRHGQVGRALCQIYAKHRDVDVLALGREQVDLTDRRAIAQTIDDSGARAVINAAAYTAVDRAEDDAELAFQVNETAPRAMADACARLDIPLVHYSTDYVFDGKAKTPYTESDPTRPLGVYGESKLAGEVAVRERLSAHVILRTSWVYDREGQNFVNTMRRLGAERDALTVVDDQFGCPTFAADLAACSAKIVARLTQGAESERERLYGTYHLAGTGMTTWCRFAQAIFGRLDQPAPAVTPITTAEFPTKAPRPAYSVLNSSKAEAMFDVRLPDWEDALSRCLRTV